MGNLIQDFWIYTWKGKSYYGLIEVVKGDLQYRRIDGKFENHITKALEYTMRNDVLSHMSLQTYVDKLKGRTNRDADEETYYPFVIEYEPHLTKNEPGYKKEYKEAIGEALRTVKYLIYDKNINEKDILVMINNSRSIYVMVNPKVYGLRPNTRLGKIYEEMLNSLNEDLGFKYVDKNIYSVHKLIKTPNAWYKGGYFVHINIRELEALYVHPEGRDFLTSKKRSLDIIVPGEKSEAFTQLYENAIDNISDVKIFRDKKGRNNQVKFIERNQSNCVKYLEKNIIEKGCRNSALISVAIHYKEKGYTQDQVEQKLLQLASKWRHDENYRQIGSQVRTVFREDYNFSCEKARAVLDIDMDSICQGCPYNKSCSIKVTKLEIHKDIIEDLWINKASTRHYTAYLELSRKKLFNKWFVPAEEGLNERTVRELCTFSNKLVRQKHKDQIFIDYKAEGKTYYLPVEFVDEKVYEQLGEYIKHYLKLIFKGYWSYQRYIIMKVSKNKIQEDLGYTNIHGVYKLLARLKDIGLAVIKKGNLVAIYYESYKVIGIEEFKDSKLAKEELQDINVLGAAASNGDSYTSFDLSKDKNVRRGSPGQSQQKRNT